MPAVRPPTLPTGDVSSSQAQAQGVLAAGATAGAAAGAAPGHDGLSYQARLATVLHSLEHNPAAYEHKELVDGALNFSDVDVDKVLPSELNRTVKITNGTSAAVTVSKRRTKGEWGE